MKDFYSGTRLKVQGSRLMAQGFSLPLVPCSLGLFYL